MTPRFGNAPWFGRDDDDEEDMVQALGEGRVVHRFGGVSEESAWTYPHWLCWELADQGEDAMLPVRFFGALERPLEGQPLPIAIKFRAATKMFISYV